MHEEITEAGAYAFYLCSRVSFEHGLISVFEYWQRLVYLQALLRPKNPVRDYILNQIPQALFPVLGPDDDREPEASERDVPKEDTRSTLASRDGAAAPATESDEPRTSDEDRIERFLTGTGVLRDRWKFHQSDADFFPSIPHGHLASVDHIKLDAYRGFTYDTKKNNQQLARESRKFIIALWNDNKFRTFALSAIDYYLEAFPKFTGWRVDRPRKLPRKRK